jgi:hypothetical protein
LGFDCRKTRIWVPIVDFYGGWLGITEYRGLFLDGISPATGKTPTPATVKEIKARSGDHIRKINE